MRCMKRDTGWSESGRTGRLPRLSCAGPVVAIRLCEGLLGAVSPWFPVTGLLLGDGGGLKHFGEACD